MRFRVIGQDDSTRKPIELTLDAPDEPAARRDAESRAIIIKSIEALAPPPGLAPAPGALQQAPHQPVLVRIEPGHVQLIELTAKRWKLLFAASSIALLGGLVWGSWALFRTPQTLARPPLTAWLAGVLAALGLVGILAARLGAWWKHG